MELLIPGLILVGLMIYASTRIKRNAAKAFEAETIETEEFTLFKPEGMLHVLNGDPGNVFEAYSKEFGTDGYRDVRRATATVRKTASGPQTNGEDIVSDIMEVIGDNHYRLTESLRKKAGGEFRVLRKSSKVNSEDFVLEVTVLDGASDDLMQGLHRMVDSFVLVD